MTRCTTLILPGRNRLGRGRVEVTGGFLLLMAWLNYCDTQKLLYAALCAAVAHELGHLAAIYALGGRVCRLRLTAAGAELRLEGTMSYGRELLCALAGPLVNLLLAYAAAQAGWLVFAGLNLALALFNLLPLSVLDGGRALSCAVAVLCGPEAAQCLLRWTDGMLAVVLLLCGGGVLLAGGNVTLPVVGTWLLGSFLCRQKKLAGKRVVKGGGNR